MLQSDVIYKKLCQVIPGGVNSPVRAFGGMGLPPMVVESGKGDVVVDVDGNRFIDFCMSWGALIFGHAHPGILDAVTQRMQKGTSFGITTAIEERLASKVVGLVDSVEKVRFVSSGTEATMSAVRVARGFTGRKIIVKFNAYSLFSSIQIFHADQPNEDNSLPITITLEEGKQRSVALGLSYSTQRGAGFTVEWENRNYRGMGQRLSFDANVLQQAQDAKLLYVIPDWCCFGQDLLWSVELTHDDTEGFEEQSLSVSGIIEKQLTPCARLSYGGMYKQLRVEDSDNDGNYSLLKAPMQLRWSNTNDFLDPICGSTLYLKIVPTLQLFNETFAYNITTLTGSIYRPFCRNRLVLAGKLHFGSILGSNRDKIPASERFYAGSENTLRGYKYFTVSPQDSDNDPKGGLSMMIYTLETRYRASEDWGGVLFYDIGNVFSTHLPKFNRKMLQSAGVGIRYYTPVGPLRLDAAFPLNRRKHHDSPFQIYFSVGQAF